LQTIITPKPLNLIESTFSKTSDDNATAPSGMEVPLDVLAPELFHREYLESGRRLDGRNPHQRRPISFTRGCIADSHGSALVALGRTIVITKVSATPQPIAPSITVSVSRAAVSSIKGSTKLDKTLTAMVRLLASKVLPLDQLEIVRPDPHNIFQTAVKLWAWHLGLQIAVISDDGALEVAAILSVQEALLSLTLPCFDLDEEAKLIANGDARSVEVRIVTGLRFAICGDVLVCDPTHDEEKLADGCCTVVMTRGGEPKLMKLSTSGQFPLNGDIMAKMTAACLE
jgi:exosome complex RNA-binding protein Rrp42 (RNase PH superfamily)